MSQYISWVLNTTLFVSCCFLTSSTANSLFASVLTPPPSAQAQFPAPTELATRSWTDRERILERNLFDSETLGIAANAAPADEDLEATQLPLKLLGTAAATSELHSWAAIQDTESRKTQVVRVGDPIRTTARVIRIERRRVILDENGSRRELVLEDTVAPQIASRTSRRAPKTVTRRPSRPRSEPRARQARPTSRPPSPATGNPAGLMSQARFDPKFGPNGEMEGLQINEPRAGSLLESVGVRHGDVIREVNGVAIDSSAQSLEALGFLSGAEPVQVVVESADGSSRTVTLEMTD